ncbi:MAG TPA: hypothetical protein VL689_09920 [Paraburkholderia sp.]|nr:hypothetical protein [Paraburkholderia sp.]
MARTNETRTAAVPGAGALFALRAIGLVLLARWLFSMAQMNFVAALTGMASSPWASINLIFLFLLIFLPGARARAERPFHPLPQWLRQALRLFALLGFVFALWSVGAFAWTAGWRRTGHAIAATNGWLVVAPALYAAVIWMCRPRALWRTNVAARRFAIGRYAISVDTATRTTTVWAESRKVGQYDARELSVRWGADARSASGRAGTEGAVAVPPPAPDEGGVAAPVASEPLPVRDDAKAGRFAPRRRPRVELLWDSPAAAGHNRQTVLRTPLTSEGDRAAARALDAALRQA